MVTIEDLVPVGHLLRKIDKYIDFEFIRNKARLAVDLVLLFKMPVIGYRLSVIGYRLSVIGSPCAANDV